MNFNWLIGKLLSGEVITATEYLTPKLVARATRRRFGKKILKNEDIEIVLKIGKPNVAERKFVKLCLKAKEPFPIKKIQIKPYDPKKLRK